MKKKKREVEYVSLERKNVLNSLNKTTPVRDINQPENDEDVK